MVRAAPGAPVLPSGATFVGERGPLVRRLRAAGAAGALPAVPAPAASVAPADAADDDDESEEGGGALSVPTLLRHLSSAQGPLDARPVRIFKGAGYVRDDLEELLRSSGLLGRAAELAGTAAEADCVLAAARWATGQVPSFAQDRRTAEKQGIPFLMLESLTLRRMLQALRPLLEARGLAPRRQAAVTLTREAWLAAGGAAATTGSGAAGGGGGLPPLRLDLDAGVSAGQAAELLALQRRVVAGELRLCDYARAVARPLPAPPAQP